jgi:putative peptidoglycan lipid II flippase
VKHNLIKSIGVIMGVSVLAKVIAFLTEVVLAGYLGTSYQADAYNMVIGIQHVFYPMLSIGIWKVFLPEYKKCIIIPPHLSTIELSRI